MEVSITLAIAPWQHLSDAMVEVGESIFTNREKAVFVWGGLPLLLLLWKNQSRAILVSFVQGIWPTIYPKILVMLSLMAVYVAFICAVTSEIGLWGFDDLKNTILWFGSAGVVLFFGIIQASEGRAFFVQTALGTVTLAVIVAFLLNVFVLSFVGELILQPLLTVLLLMRAVAATDRQFAAVERVLDVMLGMISFGLIAWAIYHLTQQWSELDVTGTASDFALPVWLTISSLPVLFLFALYAGYERTFSQMRGRDGSASLSARRAVITSFHIRLHELSTFAGSWPIRTGKAASFQKTRREIVDFRRFKADARRAEQEEQDGLRDNAGVDGENDEGGRLDRREFSETKQALLSLASAQMGWYRNGGRYRTEARTILDTEVARGGLPESHGIELQISKDGQSWWAWRRTVSDWHFGIGATQPPADQWLFDGPSEPQGPPTNDHGWSQFGIDAKNW